MVLGVSIWGFFFFFIGIQLPFFSVEIIFGSHCLEGVILKCIFSSLPSTRPFGSLLASGSVGTPKLSENEARALPGWVTHWEVAREFPKTKP
ncbi:unnamed protein product [Malus baccata var. baccata]